MVLAFATKLGINQHRNEDLYEIFRNSLASVYCLNLFVFDRVSLRTVDEVSNGSRNSDD